MTNQLPWENIETVLLDMDGTLLDLHFDNYFWQYFLPRQYALKHKLAVEDALKKIENMYEREHGSLAWYSVDHWQEELGLNIMDLKKQEAHRIAFRPSVKDFLDFLSARKITPVLVTNAHPKSLALKMQHCSLQPWIKNQFSTHDIGLAKEHPNFWKRFHEIFSFNKKTTLFIDDNEAVLNNAKKYGIAHLYSVAFPDSTQTEINASRFPSIKDFKEIIN